MSTATTQLLAQKGNCWINPTLPLNIELSLRIGRMYRLIKTIFHKFKTDFIPNVLRFSTSKLFVVKK